LWGLGQEDHADDIYEGLGDLHEVVGQHEELVDSKEVVGLMTLAGNEGEEEVEPEDDAGMQVASVH
jgi:hypothetical protein